MIELFNKKKIILLISMLALLLFTACADDIDGSKEELDKPEEDIVQLEEDSEDEDVEEEIVEEVDPKEKIDLSLKPNEAGQAMILMYHNIGEEEAEWTRTPENFRQDLVNLYERGYRAVSLEDYVNNDMDLEAGMTPVVLTFDDGNENNFRMIQDANGEDIIDPDSAIGILEEFKKEYPDFNTTATFYVFGTNIFRQPDFIDYKLNFLVENGYDIGNHTLDHRSMRAADNSDYIVEGLGKQVEIINDILPDYEVNTYALCYGERPDDELAEYLASGTYNDIAYNNIAILNVGWNPVKSPIVDEFNPLSIPRIRASETKVENVGMYDWMEYFDNNPSQRYISDGVKEVITVPESQREKIAEDRLGEKELYIYEDDQN